MAETLTVTQSVARLDRGRRVQNTTLTITSRMIGLAGEKGSTVKCAIKAPIIVITSSAAPM